MDAPQLVIRVAGTIKELQANLAEGVNQIETTKAALQRMASSYDGSKIISQAGATAKAIQDIGGVSKLTADEQARALPILDQAIAKYQALGKDVPPGLQAIATSIRGNQTAWESFVGGFDLKAAITDPMGAATGAATALTGAMGPMGVAIAAATTLGIGFATAAFDMADKAGRSGERLYDLSLKTGMAIEPLSKISKAATIAGGDIDQVGTAMFMLGKNVEEHGDKVAKGMNKIGLSLSDIKKLQPDQQFLAIAQALSTIHDPMERNAAASELFGRSARDLMPLLLDINNAMERTSNMKGWTAEQAKDAKNFEMDLRQLKIQIDAVEMGIGKQLLPSMQALTSVATSHLGILPAFLGPITHTVGELTAVALLVERISGAAGHIKVPDVKPPVGGADTSVDDQAAAMAKAEIAAARLEARLSGLADATAGLTSQQMRNIETLHKMGASDKEISDLVLTSVDAVHTYIEREKELAKQVAETDAILMIGFERRTAGLKAVTEANLKAYNFGGQIASLHQLMASEEALARSVYNQLTSEKDRAKVIEELGLRRIDIQTQINAIEVKHAGVVNAAIIAEFEARRRLDAAQGINTQGYYGEIFASEKLQIALDDLHKHREAGIKQVDQEIEIEQRLLRALYDEQVARERAAGAARGEQDIYKDLNNVGLLSNDEWLNKLVADHQKLEVAINATTAAQKAALAAFSIDPSTLSPEMSGARGAPGSFQYEMWQANHGMFFRNNPPPMRAEGGPVSAGMPYVVGERGPEVFVPGSAGTVVPNGAGGVVLNLTVHVTQPFGTPQAIARHVGNASIEALRSQGVRFPSTV